MTKKPETDAVTGVDTTGHEWDGVKELNNPLPRWWLIMLWATVVWAIGYWIVMPAWPGMTGYTKGVRGHSERANVEKALGALEAARAEQMTKLLAISNVAEIEKDPALFEYAMAAGKSIFGDNCATCHGAGGQGFPGYPNLNDDSWLWGGTYEDLQATIRYGIRSGHANARVSVMQAFGRDGLLNPVQIDDVVEYVSSLSGGATNPEAAARGREVFTLHCVACHGADGKGDQKQGAPNLTDAIWLFGGDKTTIRETIHGGRAGVMPAWEGRLTTEEILALSAYVHSLGGGE
jgi:cytochrome c oxidase cbb3-type subunit 3